MKDGRRDATRLHQPHAGTRSRDGRLTPAQGSTLIAAAEADPPDDWQLMEATARLRLMPHQHDRATCVCSTHHEGTECEGTEWITYLRPLRDDREWTGTPGRIGRSRAASPHKTRSVAAFAAHVGRPELGRLTHGRGATAEGDTREEIAEDREQRPDRAERAAEEGREVERDQSDALQRSGSCRFRKRRRGFTTSTNTSDSCRRRRDAAHTDHCRAGGDAGFAAAR